MDYTANDQQIEYLQEQIDRLYDRVKYLEGFFIRAGIRSMFGDDIADEKA